MKNRIVNMFLVFEITLLISITLNLIKVFLECPHSILKFSFCLLSILIIALITKHLNKKSIKIISIIVCLLGIGFAITLVPPLPKNKISSYVGISYRKSNNTEVMIKREQTSRGIDESEEWYYTDDLKRFGIYYKNDIRADKEFKKLNMKNSYVKKEPFIYWQTGYMEGFQLKGDLNIRINKGKNRFLGSIAIMFELIYESLSWFICLNLVNILIMLKTKNQADLITFLRDF